jgi:carboxyl-terminal processing protease
MFSFTDKDYTDFKNFLKKREFSYQNPLEESFNELVEVAKKENSYDRHKEIFAALEKNFSSNIDNDLDLDRDEITELLESEIIKRYFYESGAIAFSIHRDEQIKKAVEILNNKELYKSILKNSEASIISRID